MKAKNIFLLGIGVAVLAGSLVLTGVLYFKLKEFNKGRDIISEMKSSDGDINTSTAFDTDLEKKDIPNLTSKAGDGEIEVNWFKGAKKLDDEEMQKIVYRYYPELKQINDLGKNECVTNETPDDFREFSGICPIYIYQVGTIKSSGVLDNEPLYLVLASGADMGFWYHEYYGYYDKQIQKMVIIKKDISSEWLSGSNFGLNKIIGGFVFKDVKIKMISPLKIKIPNQNSFLLLKGAVAGGTTFSPTGPSSNIGGIFDAAKGEIVKIYKPEESVFVDKNGPPVYFGDNNFMIQLEDGSSYIYSLIPYFFTAEEIKSDKNYYPLSFDAKINWKNGNNNIDQYRLGGDMNLGCGSDVDITKNIVSSKEWFSQDKLVQVGETEIGEKIYEFSDKIQNEYYKKLFEIGYEGSKLMYAGNNYEKISKELATKSVQEKMNDFVSDTPIIFWQDHWGNWRVYFKEKYRSLAECGKPVIYLYPEKEMNVKVEVKPNGGFTKTEPMYDNGWLVRATPQSDLFNYTDRQNYPYLFWEGKAYDYVTPNYGFVIAKKDVGTKMTQILAKLGLNEKESKDFLEFWQPKLEVSPYVFVTFLPQTEFDKLAPLTVNPKPTTVIRVFMDYTPLENPIEVAPMYIKTPKRNGFTVVEWGGRLK